MIIAEHILGNIQKDHQWKEKLANAKIDVLILDQWEAQKSRCRKNTQNGVDIGISLERNVLLSDGDIIFFDEITHSAIIVEITLRDIMVINLQDLKTGSAEQQIRRSFELGHALGNQHWKAVIKDNHVYIPLTVNQKVMSSVMKTHNFSQDSYQFVKGSTILDKLTNSESRLLFGGAEDSDVHVHVEHNHDHYAHKHEHAHDHGHHHKH